MSFETAVQAAIYNALTAGEPLPAVVSGVFDNVAPGYNRFPYVTIGEALHSEWDTATESGQVVTVSVHTWSRQAGRSETKTIQGAIYDALHRATLIDPAGVVDFIDCQFLTSETFIDTDGLTRHGVQQFKILTTL